MAKSVTVPREEIVLRLIEQDRYFYRLHEEHKKLENQLIEFNGKRHLSGEDELEKKRIQKLKLQTKDQMEQLILNASKAKGTIG